MTKQAKIILGAVGGLVLIGGFIFIAAAAIIGLSVMAAQSDDDTKESKPAVTRDKNGNTKQQKKSDDADEKNENQRKSNDDLNDESDKTKAASLNGSLAPELVGKWIWSEGSRQVDNTGKTQYGGGSWHTYEFSPDGAVRYTMKKDLLTIMQCQINETKTGQGKAVSDGETLAISFGEMQDTGTSSCGGEDNFDKTIPAETVELKYELKTEYGETSFCIEGENGEQCYQKAKE